MVNAFEIYTEKVNGTLLDEDDDENYKSFMLDTVKMLTRHLLIKEAHSANQSQLGHPQQ
jgi:hypothetical protein